MGLFHVHEPRSIMKTYLCHFSGFKIHPGHGKVYVRQDSKVFRFINAKSEKLFKNKKNPRKIDWTTVYRRMHKKGLVEDTKRKRQRKVAKAPRAIVGLTTEQLFAKRNQSDEARKAAREAVKAAKAKKAVASKKDKKSRKQQPRQEKAAAKVQSRGR